MTISSENTRISYAGNGSTKLFGYTWKILAADHLTVWLVENANGDETLQVLDTDYTVTGVGTGGGNVDFVTAPPTGFTVVIYLDPPLTQLTDYQPGDPFPAESHEDALDLLTNQQKRTRDLASRSIHLPEGDAAGIVVKLQPAVLRKGKLLGFDATTGDVALFVPTLDGVFEGDLQLDASQIVTGELANARISSSSVRQFFGSGRIRLIDEINITGATTGTLDISALIGTAGRLMIHGFAYLASDGLFRIRAQTDVSPIINTVYSVFGRGYLAGVGGSDIEVVGDTEWYPFGASGGELTMEGGRQIRFLIDAVSHAVDDPENNPSYSFRGGGWTNGPTKIFSDVHLELDGSADDGDDVNALQFVSNVNFSSLHAEAWLFDAP